MLHLLPQYQKRKVTQEYRIRLAAIVVWALFASVIVFIVFLLPAFFALLTEKNTLLNEKESNQSIIDVGNAQNSGGSIDITRAVEALKPQKNSLIPNLFVSAIDKAAAGVVITGYSLAQANAGDPIAVVITGSAKKREDLSLFAKSLNDIFGGVRLPLSSLAKQSDIPFEFKFQMDYNKTVEYLNQGKTTQIQ